jgi:hypothetical protein
MRTPRSRRGHSTEVVIVAVVLVLAVIGGGVAFFIWSRALTSKMEAEAAQAQAQASRTAVQQLRDAQKMARGGEPEETPAADPGAPGKAMERNLLLRRAIDSADTPERRAEARDLIDRTVLDVESRRIEDSAEAIATLRMTLGDGYRTLGERDLALRQFKAALDARTKALGEQHPDTIRARMAVEELQKSGK